MPHRHPKGTPAAEKSEPATAGDGASSGEYLSGERIVPRSLSPEMTVADLIDSSLTPG